MPKRILKLGAACVLIDLFFDSAEEANEWLDFDSSTDEQEYFVNYQPDHYEEWLRWRDSNEAV